MTDENESGLTSNELFGDLIDDDKSPVVEEGKRPKRDEAALDKMLAETLSGVRIAPPKRRESEAIQIPVNQPAEAPADATVAMSQPVLPPKPVPPADATVAMSQPVLPPKPVAPPTPPPPAPRPVESRSSSMSSDLDKLLENTLSGIDKRDRPSRARAPEPPPKVEIPPVPSAVVPSRRPPTAPRKAEKVTASSPILAKETVSSIPVEDEPAGIKFGQYVLQDKIATGGMAEVWKARMRGVEGFQKIVAIKKILPHLSDNSEFVTMFVDEAKLAAQLNHNNIIHIYDLGKISSSYFIAMEYIDGFDLKTILSRGAERGQPMPMEIALFITSKIGAALDYAHRKRDFNEKNLELVHRDVSPQNVLISQEGDIKLCDFGIAKAASKASHTQAGALKGKLQYMSPEQAWGRKIDRRSDIFALGAVLFEMLCGRKLFQGDNELSILEQVREAQVTLPSKIDDEIPADVDAIVLKALQKESDQRYQTAGDMARDLDAILYSFKPTPTSADLAIYMHRIWSDEAMTIMAPSPFHQEEEQVEDNVIAIKPVAVPPIVPIQPAPVPVAAAAAPAPAPAISAPAFGVAPQEEKKLPIVPIAIGVAVVAAIAIGGFMMTRGDKGAVPSAVPAATSTVATATSTGIDPAATDTLGLSSTADVQTTTALGTPLSADPAKVEEEVRKRIEAERLKLEQQKAQQALAAQQKGVPVAVVPEPVPVQKQPDPEPAPIQVAPPPLAAPPPPAVREEPQVAKVREGELVQPGAQGLTAPEVIKQHRPPYPQMAKAQKVEGIVIVQALISETGAVLETKILRGSPMLNDAALEAVRRTTFRPGTKDGVKVKSYKTMTIPFKL